MKKKVTIIFIRHSESEDDLNNSYGGCADWKLTENGRKTILKRKKLIDSFEIEKYYSSPLSRAFETAKILSDNGDVTKVFDLREINTYGVMSGLEKSKAKELFAYLLERDEYQKLGYYNGKSFFGGEAVREFDKRVKSAICEIVAKTESEKTIAIVTHGGVFRSIFKNILKVDGKIEHIEDVAFAKVEVCGKNFVLKEKNGIKIGEKI